MNKKWQLLLGSTLALTLVACGNGDTSDGGNGGSTEPVDISELPEPGDFETQETLQLSGMVTKGGVEDGNYVQERLEEEFNVEIINTHTDTWDSNETAILVASNELPDTFTFTTGGMSPREFYEDGMTRSIPREMIETYAPRYAEMLDTIDNGLGWRMNLVPGSEDEYTALVGLQSHTEGIIWAPTLRMDWLENLGFDIPEDAEPIGDEDGYERIYWTDYQYTMEELEEILLAFTNDDPDGDGQNNTYGMLPFNNNTNWGMSYFGAYGLGLGYNLIEDDQLKPALISEAYRDALINLADWYEQGIIDPEWTTLDEQNAWEKYQSGSIGYYIAQRTYLAQESWTEGRAPHNILNADPDAKLLAFPGEVGPEGKSGQASYLPVTLLGDAHHISASVTDAELARYLQMFDFINHDPGGIWTNFGVPGEHSEWAAKPYKSTLRVKPEFTPEEGEIGFMAYRHRTYPGDSFYWLSELKTVELMDRHFAHPDVVEEMAIRPATYDLFNETEQTEITEYYGGQLDTITSEFRTQAITGEIDVEAEWDAYVQRYLDSGGTELIEEMEKAPTVEELLGEDPIPSNVPPIDEEPELPDWEDPAVLDGWD